MRDNSNLIRDFARKDVANAIAAFESSRKIEHPGVKGRAREIFTQRLLRKFLSADFAFGSGIIIDRFGAQSSETDLILHCPEVLPPYLLDHTAGYFPVESAIYAFEVKSRLTNGEIADAVKKFARLDQLENLFHPQFDQLSSFPITVLFAFESDLKKSPQDEFERFKAALDNAGPNKHGVPVIRVFCVIGRGYWYHADAWINGKKRRGWWHIRADEDHNEVLGLVGGVINTVRSEKLKRYGLAFGNYIITEHPVSPAD
jgi:hypothetical protein